MCMYICMNIYIYTHHTYIYIYMYTHIQVYICIVMFTAIFVTSYEIHEPAHIAADACFNDVIKRALMKAKRACINCCGLLF